MTDSTPYISRTSAQKMLDNFGRALKQPGSSPLVFYTYGIGGVGKSTLLEKLRETYDRDAVFARAFFGPTSRIDSPLALMEHLYKQLPEDEWGEEAFTDLCKKYKETLNKLETEPPEGKGSASLEQVSLVKKLLGGAVKAVASWNMPDKAAEQLSSAAEGVVDMASLVLAEKDRTEQLLKKHQATKNKRDLQELMLDPLPKLTQAFAEGVIQKSRQKPIVLELDTYEKASSEFDIFLCKHLLGDTALQTYPIRIVMAGRYALKNKRYQRMFLHHGSLIYECQLEKFDKDETKKYLRDIGIVQPDDVRRLAQVSKGLPYVLSLIKAQKDNGRSPSILRDSDEIVDRLLDGLDANQRQVVELASYCRWFNRPMIQHLVKEGLTPQSQSEGFDWFGWLIERDFVISEETYRIHDVARDIIRAAQHREDEQGFRSVHDRLAHYFQGLADQEVSPDQAAPAKYENSDWQRYSTEVAYHKLFAHRDKGQFQLLTYFFEGAHFEQPDIAIEAFTAVAAEAEPVSNELLPRDTQQFLESIQFAVMFGWRVIGSSPKKYDFNIEVSESSTNPKRKSIKSQIESALETCFQKVDRLTGLAKYAGLMGKIVRCQPNRRLALIQQAREEVERILTLAYPEFSSDLFLDVGAAFGSLDLFQESLDSCDKAIEHKPDNYKAWHGRGLALNELELYQEALSSYDKAVEIEPSYYGSWNNRGLILRTLKRYEESLDSLITATELNPTKPGYWKNQGLVLEELERYDEALDSYDKAVGIKPDDCQAWFQRGDVLMNLRQYEDALVSFDRALQTTKGEKGIEAIILNVRGLCLSFLNRYEEATGNINKAKDLNEGEEIFYFVNQGIVLARAGRYEEALALCEQALQLKEDEEGHYGKACCYALQSHDELAIASLQQAIQYAPQRCCVEAKYNPDFDRLRYNEQFQALIAANEK
jgi:tetratricopeptide (TPR) repeat protein